MDFRIDVAHGMIWRTLLDDGTHRVDQSVEDRGVFRFTGNAAWGEIILLRPEDWATVWKAYKETQ